MSESASEEDVLSSALRESVDNTFRGNVPVGDFFVFRNSFSWRLQIGYSYLHWRQGSSFFVFQPATEEHLNSNAAMDAINELLNTAIQHRLEEDPDYDPARYPEIARKFGRKP